MGLLFWIRRLLHDRLEVKWWSSFARCHGCESAEQMLMGLLLMLKKVIRPPSRWSISRPLDWDEEKEGCNRFCCCSRLRLQSRANSVTAARRATMGSRATADTHHRRRFFLLECNISTSQHSSHTSSLIRECLPAVAISNAV